MTSSRFTALVSLVVISMLAVQAKAQVVVLPSGQITLVGTTVNVPDGGFVLLGNVYYGAEGRIQHRIPGLPCLPIFGVTPLWNHRAYGFYHSEPQIYLGVRFHNLAMRDRSTLLQGQQIMEAKRAAGYLPPEEKPLPTRIPSSLKRSFFSER